MKHKKLKKITLCTVNNGYELTIGKDSYFYFDIPTLIEGVMVHVGLHHTEDMSRDDIKHLVQCAIENPTRNNMLDKIAELEDKVEMLKRQVKNAQDRVKTKNDCYYKYHKRIEELLENPDKTEACDKIYKFVRHHQMLKLSDDAEETED